MTNDPDSSLPKYPKKARQEKTEGLVQLDVDVGTDGKVKDLKVLEGDPLLADASVHAVRKWRFYAAEKDGRPFEEWATIRVDFRWDGEHVRAQVVSYPEDSPSRAQ
jgi:protein TonB